MNEPLDNPTAKPRLLDDSDDLMDTLMGGPSILSPFAPVITLRGEVDDRMAGSFRAAVDKIRYGRRSEVALLEINSVGGSLFAAMEMINTMQSSGIDWITYNASHAFSAGALLLSFGNKGARFMSPMASAMIHGLSCGTAFEGVEDVASFTDHHVKLNDMMLEQIARNCGKSLSQLKKIIKDSGSRDLWLTPKQAVELNLVDKIGFVALDPVQGFQLTVTDPAKKSSKNKK